jgi:hypothetical protein
VDQVWALASEDESGFENTSVMPTSGRIFSSYPVFFLEIIVYLLHDVHNRSYSRLIRHRGQLRIY